MNVTLYKRAADGSVLPTSWRGDRLTQADLEDVERITLSKGMRNKEDEDWQDVVVLDIEIISVAARWNADLTGSYDDYD